MCQQCSNTSYRQRFFANFMAKDDDTSYVQYKEKKARLFSEVSGRVLEIGPGTGVNFRFLPKEVQWVGVEPNLAMHPYLEKEAQKYGIQTELLSGTAEDSGIESGSVDFVISTIVLCSVDDVVATLKEVKRVLKPGGKFLFLEHQADEAWTARWLIQKIVPYTPWRYFSDGCNPSRKLSRAISTAGFESVEYQKYMQEGEGLILAVNRPHIFGWAQKSAH